MEVKITDQNFESYRSGELPLVVDVWATWCAPCRALGPVISQLAEEYDGRVVVGKANADDCEDMAAEYGVRGLPTLLFFKKGDPDPGRIVGAASKAKIEEMIKTLL